MSEIHIKVFSGILHLFIAARFFASSCIRRALLYLSLFMFYDVRFISCGQIRVHPYAAVPTRYSVPVLIVVVQKECHSSLAESMPGT